VGPEAARGFNIYRNGVKVALVEPQTFVDTGLAPSTSYTYTVTSVSGPMESLHSAPATGTTTSAWQCASFYSSNYEHVQKGRATTSGGNCFAVGSGAAMGLYNTFVHHTLAETSQGYYALGECPRAVL
jgi:poly(3-hydroxybutyrate) depolymerase